MASKNINVVIMRSYLLLKPDVKKKVRPKSNNADSRSASPIYFGRVLCSKRIEEQRGVWERRGLSIVDSILAKNKLQYEVMFVESYINFSI